jgi:hypothetical protein
MTRVIVEYKIARYLNLYPRLREPKPYKNLEGHRVDGVY